MHAASVLLLQVLLRPTGICVIASSPFALDSNSNTPEPGLGPAYAGDGHRRVLGRSVPPTMAAVGVALLYPARYCECRQAVEDSHSGIPRSEAAAGESSA